MNPELPSTPRQELEVRLTALLLGELPPNEAAALREVIAKDAELAKLHDRLRTAIDLVGAAAASSRQPAEARPAPLRLSERRRQDLLRRLKTVTPREFAKPRWWEVRASVVGIAAALAGLLLLAAMLMPALSKAKSKGQSLSYGTWSIDHSDRYALSAPAPAEKAPDSLTAAPQPPAARLPAKTERRASGTIVLPATTADTASAAAGPFESPTRTVTSVNAVGYVDLPTELSPPPPSSADSFRVKLPTGGEAEAGVAGKLNEGKFEIASAAPHANRTQSLDETPASSITAEVVSAADDPAAKTQRELDGKKAKLAELQHFADTVHTRLYSERTEVDLPKTPQVEIAERAVPASKPSLSLSGIWNGDASRYKSTARVKVERDQSDIAGLQDHSATPSYDPYFVQTESEVIRSRPILDKVVADLKLTEAWGKQGKKIDPVQAREMLKQKLSVQSVPDTGLLEIRANSDKPDEAAKIANAVADSYQSLRLEQRKQHSREEVEALTRSLKEADKKVELAQAELDRLQNTVAERPAPPADAPLPKPSVPAPIPQPEFQTRVNAFSTFSLNVSDVSYKLAAASLQKGLLPEPESIRSEEFINAFDYRDPEPGPGARMGFAWDRARYPFAQNRDLLRFSLKTAAQGRQAGRPMNLVLLLDNSGSMERADRVRIIREALRVLAGQLHPQDTLSVVTFARTARLLADGVPGNQAATVVEEAGGLTPQGGTNLEEAMNLAYQTALRHYLANGINRVVLLTDGAANLGNVDADALKRNVETHRKQGVALDCFGIGWEGYNDDLLEVLSRNGDGRYGFINTPEEAAAGFAAQLAGALQVAAADVKVQVEFNPNRVTAYRQLGYAKHQLTKEQFRDNTVDAAEIGAAESGNALYVAEINPAGTGPLGTVRVRYKAPETGEYREQEWAVPYTGAAPALDQANPAMRLAGVAGAFSEWLANSPYGAEATPARLLPLLHGVPSVFAPDARPKQLQGMIEEAQRLGGR